MKHWILGHGVLALSLALPGMPVAAQGFPDHAVTIVVPYTPGGPTDSATRIVAQQFSEQTGQPFVISNRPGAATTIGADAVKRAANDGYTWLLGTTTTFSLNPLTLPKLDYGSKDFEPIGPIAKVPYAVTVSSQMPVKNIQEFRDWLKTKPEGFSYGTVGRGSPPHIIGEILGKTLDAKTLAVHYKGSSPVQTDLVAGRINLSIDPLNTSLPMHKAEKVRIIAVIDDQRWPELPDVPTLAEQGINEVEGYSWAGLFAPAGTPKEAVDKASTLLQKITATDEVGKQLRNAGMVPMSMSHDEFKQQMQADAAWWKQAVEENDIQVGD